MRVLSLTVLAAAATAAAAAAGVLAPRAVGGTYEAALAYNATGGGYLAQVMVGTPPQPQTLLVNTNDADMWVVEYDADLCWFSSDMRDRETGCDGHTYDPSHSSTSRLASQDGFGTSGRLIDIKGNVFNDTVVVGGATATGLSFGAAVEYLDRTHGSLGLGYRRHGMAQAYPTLLDVLQAQGQIATRAYSLYLNDKRAPESGSLLLGGLDMEKFDGPLVPLDAVRSYRVTNRSEPESDYSVLAVALIDMTVLVSGSGGGGNASMNLTAEEARPVALPRTLPLDGQPGAVAALLDSTSPLLYVPTGMADALYDAAGVTWDNGDGYINCAANVSLRLTFGNAAGANVTITVPPALLALDVVGYDGPRSDWDPLYYLPNACLFGVQIHRAWNEYDLVAPPGGYRHRHRRGRRHRRRSSSYVSPDDEDYVVLGQPVLSALYAVVDMDHNQVGLAQARPNSTASAIYPLPANSTGLPTGLVGGDPPPPYTPFTPAPLSSADGAVRVPGGLLAGLFFLLFFV